MFLFSRDCGETGAVNQRSARLFQMSLGGPFKLRCKVRAMPRKFASQFGLVQSYNVHNIMYSEYAKLTSGELSSSNNFFYLITNE